MDGGEILLSGLSEFAIESIFGKLKYLNLSGKNFSFNKIHLEKKRDNIFLNNIFKSIPDSDKYLNYF